MENLTTLSVARIIRRRMNATLEKTYKEAVEACLKEYLDYKKLLNLCKRIGKFISIVKTVLKMEMFIYCT